MMRSSPLRLKELFFPLVAVKALVPVAPEKSERELDLDSLAISFGLDFAVDGKTASAGLKIASKDALPIRRPKVRSTKSRLTHSPTLMLSARSIRMRWPSTSESLQQQQR